MGSKQFGYNLLRRINTELGDTIIIDMEPKFLGRHLTMVISPTAKKSIKSSTSTVGITSKKPKAKSGTEKSKKITKKSQEK